MTTKADFTEEEWATLVRAPMVAGAAISLADPGGPIEFEGDLRRRQGRHRLRKGGATRDRSERSRARCARSPISGRTRWGDFKLRGALAGKEILDEVGRANEIVSSKGTPEEAEAFRVLHPGVREASRRGREGGRLQGLPRRAREPGREEHARAAPVGTAVAACSLASGEHGIEGEPFGVRRFLAKCTRAMPPARATCASAPTRPAPRPPAGAPSTRGRRGSARAGRLLSASQCSGRSGTGA